jgi:hypothetical protein
MITNFKNKEKYTCKSDITIHKKHQCTTACSLINQNATATSWLPGGTAWLTAKCYNIQVKHHSIKTIKSTYLYYKRCWKWCQCDSCIPTYQWMHHIMKYITLVPQFPICKPTHFRELCLFITNFWVRKWWDWLTKNAANSNTHAIHGRIIEGAQTIHNQSSTAVFIKCHILQYPVTAQCE